MFGARCLLGATALLLLCACSSEKAKTKLPPPVVGVVVVRERTVALQVELPGRTSPFAVSEIRPQVSGIIRKRLFIEGATVKPGQPLYQIDAAPYQAAFDKAQATLAGIQGRAGRYATLVRANAIAAQANDDAQSAWRQAKADADGARINLNYTRILAPIGGHIGASSVTQGALVTAQQMTPLATIATLDPIYVDIDQSSAELLALRHAAGRIDDQGSAPVRLKMQDGTVYPLEGKLQFADVMVDPATGAVRLRALFPNPDSVLMPGLHVSAVLTQGSDLHGVLVSQHSVGRNARGEATAFVVDSNNIARLRTLRVGRAVGPFWQVLDGLKPGERMIVDGLLRVKADKKVTPRPIAAATAEQP